MWVVPMEGCEAAVHLLHDHRGPWNLPKELYGGLQDVHVHANLEKHPDPGSRRVHRLRLPAQGLQVGPDIASRKAPWVLIGLPEHAAHKK